MTTRSQQFDELVLDAASRMEQHAGNALGGLEFAVEDVPPSDPAAWESSDVPLGRLFAAQGKVPARIVVYRRPVETRTSDPRELAALVNDIIVEQVASLLGVDPRDLDSGYEPDGG
jgi:predicted Zn-dependent protease with MMP-like domain